jgi:hypothetical protein
VRLYRGEVWFRNEFLAYVQKRRSGPDDEALKVFDYLARRLPEISEEDVDVVMASLNALEKRKDREDREDEFQTFKDGYKNLVYDDVARRFMEDAKIARLEEGTPKDYPGRVLTPWLETWKNREDKIQAPARF